jgi:hypothetical protein
VLGEIKECGAPHWQRIAAALRDAADRVLAVGACGDSLAGLLGDTPHLTVVPDVHEAARQLSGTLAAGDVVLLHGARDTDLILLLGLLGEVAQPGAHAALEVAEHQAGVVDDANRRGAGMPIAEEPERRAP